MNKNEIAQNNKQSLSTEVKTQPKNIYALASIYRVFFARLFDIVISAIPGIIMAWTIPSQKTDDWVGAAINLGAGIGFIIFFFMIIPIILKGNTVGKLIFGIRLRRNQGDKKVKSYMIIARESFFLIIPWVVAVLFFIIAIFVLKASKPTDVNEKGTSQNGAMIIYQLGYIFFLLWFLFICISVKVQPEHQSGIDIKFGLFVVYKDPIKKIENKKPEEKLKRQDKHVSLSDMPGNFSEENIKELKNDEKNEFDKSISLDDLDITPADKLVNKKDEQDKIETKDGEE